MIFMDIINWEKVFEKSEEFKNNSPFRFTYVENFFNQDFYDKLYSSYPNIDKTWHVEAGYRKNAKFFPVQNDGKSVVDANVLADEWNQFRDYFNSKEFKENISKFTGIDVSKVIASGFIAQERGDFQLPHIDVDGEYKNSLQMLMYFSKGWEKGDPGGTYISTEEDEDSIIFEPYNLDNSMVIFEETPISWHGTRMIQKDVQRQGYSISLV